MSRTVDAGSSNQQLQYELNHDYLYTGLTRDIVNQFCPVPCWAKVISQHGRRASRKETKNLFPAGFLFFCSCLRLRDFSGRGRISQSSISQQARGASTWQVIWGPFVDIVSMPPCVSVLLFVIFLFAVEIAARNNRPPPAGGTLPAWAHSTVVTCGLSDECQNNNLLQASHISPSEFQQ